MKHILFTLTLLGGMMFTMVTMLSCSKDDDQFLAETSNATDTISNMADSLAVDFYLQTVEGIRTTTFQSGENIVFHLLLRNKSNQQVQLPPAKTLIGYDLFCVYENNGTEIRAPWDSVMTVSPYNRPKALAAGDSLTLECAWDYLSHRSVTPPLQSIGSFRPVLAGGQYYSIVSLQVDSAHALRQRVDFTVQGDVNPTSFVPSGEMEDVFSMTSGDIRADFCLKNAQDEPVTTFAVGEDITFDLTLTNTGSTTFRFEKDIFHVLGNDLFRVYSSDGQDMGTSWFFGPAAEANLRIAPGKQLHYHINRSSLRRLSYTEPLCLKAGNQPLSAGRYFVIAPVCINEEINFFCVINFEVT